MRQTILSVGVAVLVVVIILLGAIDVYGGTTFLGVVLLLSALAAALAAFAWSPRAVLVAGIVLLLVNLLAVALFHAWGSLGPILGTLLVVDVLAVGQANRRREAARLVEERDGLARIGRALSECRTITDFAEVVGEYGQSVVGPGTVRLWVLDRQREELRQVRSSDLAFLGIPEPETRLASPDRVSLDDALDPRARAFHLAQPVEVIGLDGSASVSEPAWDERVRLENLAWLAMPLRLLKGFVREQAGEQSGKSATLAEPIQWQAQTVGVLTYERLAGPSGGFTADDHTRLESIAALCAAAIGTRQAFALAIA